MDHTSTIPSFYPAPAAIRGGARTAGSIAPGTGAGAGAISGGLLRPGAIDQPKFKAMLQAAQIAQAGGQAGNQAPQQPLSVPAPKAEQPSPLDGIPSLTPAQFALLTSGQVESAPAVEPTGPETLISGKPIPQIGAQPAALSQPEPETEPEIPAQPQPVSKSGTEANATATDQPGSNKVATEDDPRVVHFKRMPDQDERKALAASGKRWVVDETPGSRKLFFGDDEKFGWDDLADLVNPLQHIPIVAQIYRAATGDEINGAAELLGALPFGPSSFLTSVADLAIRESTGKDMGSNVIAMLFGHDDEPAGGAPAAGTLAAKPDANVVPADGGVAIGAPVDGVPANALQTAFIQPSPGGADRDNGGHEFVDHDRPVTRRTGSAPRFRDGWFCDGSRLFLLLGHVRLSVIPAKL